MKIILCTVISICLLLTASFAEGNVSSEAADIVIKDDTYKSDTTDTDEAPRLEDIEGCWAEEEIEKLYEKGKITGKTSTAFAPYDEITRAEFAKMFALAMNYETEYADVGYKDIEQNAWYSSYVNALYAEGIMMGENGYFYPEENITLEEIIVSSNRAYKKNHSFSADFYQIKSQLSERAVISSWAENEVLYAAGYGLLYRLFGNGNIRTNEDATRAEAAAILYRLSILYND